MVKETDYMISDQEILGGIKTAVERGSTLKQAMMTFYQAGYDKTEIEDAARAYMNQQRNEDMNLNPAQIVQKNEIKKEASKEEVKNNATKQLQPNLSSGGSQVGFGMSSQKELVPQKVSSYEMPKKKEVKAPRSSALTFILIFVLLFLLGILASVYLFKDELIQFINSMFG